VLENSCPVKLDFQERGGNAKWSLFVKRHCSFFLCYSIRDVWEDFLWSLWWSWVKNSRSLRNSRSKKNVKPADYPYSQWKYSLSTLLYICTFLWHFIQQTVTTHNFCCYLSLNSFQDVKGTQKLSKVIHSDWFLLVSLQYIIFSITCQLVVLQV